MWARADKQFHPVAAIKEEQHIAIDLTKKRIENSPSLSTDLPGFRQFEETYYGYHEWPMYWAGPYMWGSYPCPGGNARNGLHPKCKSVGSSISGAHSLPN